MYLDPGFGSMIIQFVVAAVAAGGAYLLIFRSKIAEFFKKKKGVAAVANEPDDKEG